MKEFLSAGTAVALTVGLAACTGPNPQESFVAKGTVQEFDDTSLELSDIQLIEGDHSIFQDGEETIFSTFRDMSCFEKETTGQLDALIEAGKIAVGDTVVVHGSVGISYRQCVFPGFTKSAYPDINYPMIDSIEVQE